jgi:hypothetical protein
MLLVTKSQMQKAGDPAFVDRTFDHLQLYYLEELFKIPDDVLKRRIAHCLEIARTFGFTFERSLVVFTANMIRVNPEFYKQSTIARVIANKDRPEEERLEAFLVETQPADWFDAEKQCDADAYWRAVDALSGEKE